MKIPRIATATQPARLLAVFIVDTDDRELTTAAETHEGKVP